jgi:hypothetical protein
MKITLIAVCASLTALIAVEPAFGNDKPKANKETKPARVATHKSTRVAHVAPRAAKPRAIAKKPSPPKHPWVGHTVTISDSERQTIRAYVRHRIDASKLGKPNGVPQGLARQVLWGNKLPLDWQKHCARGMVLPSEVHKNCQPLPYDVTTKLPPPPPGTILLAVDGAVVRVGYPTYEILDMFDIYPLNPEVLMSSRR